MRTPSRAVARSRGRSSPLRPAAARRRPSSRHPNPRPSLLLPHRQPAPQPAPAPAPQPVGEDPAAAAARVTAAVLTEVANRVHFDFDKSDIRPEDRPTLDRKASILGTNGGLRLRISGHADERGSDEYNLALGNRRAAAVKTYLINKGIEAGRLEVVSYGRRTADRERPRRRLMVPEPAGGVRRDRRRHQPPHALMRRLRSPAPWLALIALGGCASKGDLRRVEEQLLLSRAENQRADSARAAQLGDVIRHPAADRRLPRRHAGQRLGQVSTQITAMKGDMANDLISIQQQLVQVQALTGPEPVTADGAADPARGPQRAAQRGPAASAGGHRRRRRAGGRADGPAPGHAFGRADVRGLAAAAAAGESGDRAHGLPGAAPALPHARPGAGRDLFPR